MNSEQRIRASRGLACFLSGGVVSRLLATAICLAALMAAGCYKTPDAGNSNAKPVASSVPSMDVTQIMERYRKVDTTGDSVARMRATIESENGENKSGGARSVGLTLYQKRQADGRRLMFVEFTDPPEERDRDAIVIINPDEQIEATRYAQSNNSFVSSVSATDEDSLFGLTLQELAGGQTEKYDFSAIGEEAWAGTEVYRVEGKLKPGAESRFAKLVMLISKENYVLLMSEFSDSRGEVLRRLEVDKVEQIAGHWTRMRWSVVNRTRAKKTQFVVTEMKYESGLSDSLFTRDRLKKLASR